jgi:long-chain acyl-CoA synthetase
VWLDRALIDPRRVATHHKEDGRWVGRTWAEGEQGVRLLAAGLMDLGVGHGDRVVILGETDPLWAQTDMAVQTLGAVTVGVYPTCTNDQIAYHLEHCGAKVAFVQGEEQLDRVREAAKGLKKKSRPTLILFKPGVEDGAPDCIAALEERGRMLPAGEPAAMAERIAAVGPEDLSTIVYTSGTTGPPKGAMLTHGQLCAAIVATREILPVDEEDLGLVFLPLAHSLQRQAAYAGLLSGSTGAFASSIAALMDEFPEVRPTVQASVPRIWEKFHAKLQARLAEAPPRRQKIAEWGFAVARVRGDLVRAGQSVPWGVERKFRLADRLVFTKLRAVFGGRIRFMLSGGAPIALELLKFFDDIGLRIYEGWGLTETAAPATLNHPGAWRFGTVGRPLPGVRIRIAEDGEIEVDGPNVFSGYYRDEAATALAFTEDGWFKTGDIGDLDDDGFLRITDRKKDIIITAGGKNIAPQNLENLLKGDPLVSQAVIIGDRRKYLTVLITLDPDDAPPAMLADPDGAATRDRIGATVAKVNSTLARYEQIKKFTVLPRDLTVEGGELTPTLKVKRRVVAERFAVQIEGMYEGSE